MTVDPETPPFDPEPPGRPSAAPDALQWQSTLLGLLGELEELRGRMERMRLLADAPRLLEFADAMVQACDTLSGRVAIASGSAATQMDALARSGAYYSAAARLRPLLSRGALGSFWSALKGQSGPSEAEIREALMLAVQAVHQYFVLFTEQFTDPRATAGWVDAATAFGSDLKQVVRDMPAA